MKSFHATALCRIALGLPLAGWMAVPPAAAQEEMVSLRPRPDGMGDRIRSAGPNNAAATGFDTGNGIQYWGGSVMLGTTHVYIIWYGTFDSGTSGIISAFVSRIGGSPYFNINAGYFDGNGNSVSNALTLAGAVQNNYSRGHSLYSSDIGAIVSDTLSGGLLPLDANGIYMVLTAGDVTVGGFGSSFCGYHSFRNIANSNVHYAFIGDPVPAAPRCMAQTSNSPNNNPAADAMASTIAHELDETVTDPNLDAWYDAGGNEVGDKCSWNFGLTYTLGNGSLANINLGGNNYYIQQDWVNAAVNGSPVGCGLSASPGPDFALWAVTDAQAAEAGSATASYAISVISAKGFSAPVNFTFSGLPAGATVGAIPPSSAGAMFQVSTASTVPAGTYTFGVTGTSGAITHPATLKLIVTAPSLSPVGSLADLASGSGWETTFTLVNLGAASTPVSLSLFGDTGTSLNLPFAFPQGASGPLNVSTVNQTIAANSLLLLDTSGPLSQALSQGWGVVSASGNVNAYEIFRYAPSAQEAVVPMETRSGSFALLFDSTSLVNTLGTGVALANLSAQPSTVPVTVKDDTGMQIASGSIQLAAHGHTAFTLSDQYPVTAGKRGTLLLGSPPFGQISALGIRANGNSFTTIPVLQSGASGGSMAHIAAGGGWRSIFYVVNLNSVTSNITLKFFDDSGAPLSLPLTYLQTGATATAASVTQALPAGAALAIESQGADSQVLLGSAQLSSDRGASGFALFRYDPSGQEATAPLETRNAPAYVLAYDHTAPLATGVALANLSNQTATVGLILRDDAGAVLQTTSLQLPPNGHSAFVLATNYPLTAGKRGTVEFTTASAPISVLGIRANGNAFTSIPVLTR